MIFEELEKYKNNNHFFFSKGHRLEEICNAPKESSGVFLIYELKNGKINLVYIGCSGKLKNDGKFQHRKGGLYDRIVNGKQFGEARRISWQKLIINEDIDALDIYWYDTFNKEIQHIPSFVEGLLLQIYFNIHGRLPIWNLEY